jgi:signal peptidase I
MAPARGAGVGRRSAGVRKAGIKFLAISIAIAWGICLARRYVLVPENTHRSADGRSWELDSRAAPPSGRAWHKAVCVGLVLVIGVAAIAVVLKAHRPPAPVFRVASGSMQPTLAIGQVVHVDASAYASALPRIGDVIAFHAPVGATGDTPICGVLQAAGEVCAQSTPAESEQIFIKRVVGAPGDILAVLGGAVLRNGVLQPEPFTVVCDGGATCNYPAPVQVPAGEWFLMGDDRGSSDDSRYWGPVPKAWIVGRVSK